MTAVVTGRPLRQFRFDVHIGCLCVGCMAERAQRAHARAALAVGAQAEGRRRAGADHGARS